jgi:hypothetical protein
MVLRRTLFVMLAVGLVAASCGSDDDDDGASDETTTSSTPEVESTPESETSAVPESLPASFRGVTESTIKVGVAVPDFDALQAAGVSNYQGDADVAFEAFFDVINSEGGIFGRQIEPVYVDFNFVDPVTQEEACLALTGDNEVFIVLYGLLGQSNLCLTDRNDTMVMTRSFQTTDLREGSGETLWLQLNAADDERTRILGEALAQSGRLEGKTIGILGRDNSTDGEVLQKTLTELGHESLLLVTTAQGNDPVARENEQAILAEKFSSEGVDFLFELQGGDNVAGVFAGVGFTPEYAYKVLGASVDGAADRSVLDGAVSVAELNEQEMFADADFQTNCMDVVRDVNPDLVDEMSFIPTGDQQANGQPNWINPIMIACDQTMLLKQLGEIAGAELTNDSFRAALDEIGPVQLNGYGEASFDSASKWDGLNEFYLQEYDFEQDLIELIGDSIVVER